MTGPEHFKEAERLLALNAGPLRGQPADLACTAAAQVHATLALAAAHADYYLANGHSYDEWNQVLSGEASQ